MMKTIFSIVKELSYVPRKLQLMVSNLMTVKVIDLGDTLIKDLETHPNAYIIAEGSFYNALPTESITTKGILHWWKKIKALDIIPASENEKMKRVLKAGNSAGDFYLVNNIKWRCHSVALRARKSNYAAT